MKKISQDNDTWEVSFVARATVAGVIRECNFVDVTFMLRLEQRKNECRHVEIWGKECSR